MPTQDEVADLFPHVIWHGKYFATTCPYHDSSPDNPSFLVYPDGAVCLSASCRKKVSLAKLAHHLKHSHTPLPAAPATANLNWHVLPEPEVLANKAHELLCAVPSQAHYLKERKVEAMIGPSKLGWWDGWYTFPIYNRHRQFAGLVLRAGPSLAKYVGRYVSPPGQRPLLYCPDWKLVERSETVYVPFGIFDALTLAQLGLPTVTPTNLKGARPELFADLRKQLVIIPDKGEEEVGHELAYGLDWRGTLLKLAYPPGLKDLNDLATHGKLHRSMLTSLIH